MTDPQGTVGHRVPTPESRDTITAHAFELDDQLLGVALARPTRRLAALLVDLLLASLLAALGGVLVGFAVAYIFFRIATRRRVAHRLKRWTRASLALLGALVLFGTVVALVGDGWSLSTDDGASDPVVISTAADPAPLRDSIFRRLEHGALDVDALQQAGLPGPVLELITPPAASIPAASIPAAPRTVTLLRDYADALAAADTLRADSLQPLVARAVAKPQIDPLLAALQRTSSRVAALTARNKALSERPRTASLWPTLRATAHDIGLGIGWVGVYFTLFLAWWSGQTPGKYLLGLRVVRLDGAPLSLWFSFERFGGYAAGLATGLLGFLQILWDPNRQGIQDRIAHTVVIRSRSSAS